MLSARFLDPLFALPGRFVGDGDTRSSLRTRLALVLASIAVPAIAAAGDVGRLAGDAPPDAAASSLPTEPMEFERPGMSFPGSAFYHLADPPTAGVLVLPALDARDEAFADQAGALIDIGPAARPFRMPPGTGYARALDCLAQAVWYEAASESEGGQRAVAQVVLNRVAHPSWPASICGVVYQGASRRTGCQFTFTCDGSLARAPGGASWARARRIAGEALAGSVYANVGLATHYHTLWVDPAWSRGLDVVGTIGAHRFYRNRGAGGLPSAFSTAYRGIEPAAPSSQAAPVRIHSAALPAVSVAPAGTVLPVAPAPTAASPPAFEAAGRVRADYVNAGKWREDAAPVSRREAAQVSESGPSD
ncbi:cell wall hydrolase [Erythrobacter sp.]|jgi:hypothetical protein|uniref:cell wall hydrolase n=1 Tax=Erythrobacter sp. TaxID=1042 RepID=UPI002EBDA8EA|nr:cell wall hydrolase [Erythrobacter sp.]